MRLYVPYAAHRLGKREKYWRFRSYHSGDLRYRRYSGLCQATARDHAAVLIQSSGHRPTMPTDDD